MKKKILAIALSASLALSMVPMAFATDALDGAALPAGDLHAERAALAAADGAGVQVGDRVWVKSGSMVYKTMGERDGYEVRGSYEFEIRAISEDGLWYELECVNWDLGMLLAFGGYKYVHADSTSTENPEAPVDPEQPECSCGSADDAHAEDCPLHEGSQGAGSFDAEDYIEFEGAAENGVTVNVSAPEGAFPEGTSIAVESVDVSSDAVAAVVDEDILGIVAVDIDFGGSQPAEPVAVKLDVPAARIPGSATMVKVVHMAKDGPELVSSSYLSAGGETCAVSFVAGGFSSYAAVFVEGKYASQRMSELLEGNTRYLIVPFSVDLFDYDPVTINNSLNSATSDDNGFHFTGYGIAGMGSNSGINNSASTMAKQGILANELDDGLPVVNHLVGTDAGKKTGQILFGDADSGAAAGKTAYDDIPFEFVLDSHTGYYEYKSSANHAQLSEDGTKIELYADTLSTQNAYVATVDLGAAAGTFDFVDADAKASSYKATAKDVNSNDRLDPYVLFPLSNVDASSVGQIYVKAKMPASVGSNLFQLFFTTNNSTGWDEGKSFGNAAYSEEIPYTANGDWIEFVVDTSENASWKDTITAIRVDLFDSNKGNLDVGGSYDIEIAEIRLIQKDYDAYATRGGFYPFSKIEDSYPGNNTAFSLAAWEELLNQNQVTTARASRAIYNPAPSSNEDLYSELAYGMAMEFDFYIPVSGKSVSGEELVYYFDGDDDLWVFVDGELVLDVGGGHGAITGTANFTTGEVAVANAVKVTGYDSGAVESDAKPYKGEMAESLFSPGKHTMKVFYLERGGSVSNCYMKFNLPQTPQGDVTVSKEVELDNVDDPSGISEGLSGEEYTFRIEAVEKGENPTQNGPWANQKYYVVDTETGKPVADDERATGSDGTFTLKDGQSARFAIPENYEVTVTETTKEINGYTYVSTTVNGEKSLAATQTTAKGEEKRFDFVNHYLAYGDLTIQKSGISEVDNHGVTAWSNAEWQSTVYNISGISYSGEIIGIDVVIHGNDSVTVKDLPLGTYTVTEGADWAWRYEVDSVYDQDKGSPATSAQGGIGYEVVIDDDGNNLTFANSRESIYWLNGDNIARNVFDGK